MKALKYGMLETTRTPKGKQIEIMIHKTPSGREQLVVISPEVTSFVELERQDQSVKKWWQIWKKK